MSEPKDHSQSGFEPPGARRFWGDYARQSRAGRHEGGGEPGEGVSGEPGVGEPGVGNGHGSAYEPGTGQRHDHECVEWCPICRTADVLRTNAPPELRDQWQSLQRDTLVTLRQLLDAYIDRLGEPPARSRTRVEDIPIE
jgi:hypothetical protein